MLASTTGAFFSITIIPPLLIRDISNALAKRTGHCVLIDNVIIENSPAGKITIDEKLNWINENIGCVPIDSVICQNPAIQSDIVNIICRDLAQDNDPHYHDKNKLINALEDCITKINAKKISA